MKKLVVGIELLRQKRSPKFQVYVLVVELVLNMEKAPGLVAVSLLNVTGNPELASSLMPLIVESATE